MHEHELTDPASVAVIKPVKFSFLSQHVCSYNNCNTILSILFTEKKKKRKAGFLFLGGVHILMAELSQVNFISCTVAKVAN